MSAPEPTRPARFIATRNEIRLWAVAIVIVGLTLPGAGLMLAGVLTLTRLQYSPGRTRLGLIALGGVFMLIDFGPLDWPFGGGSDLVVPAG